MLVCACAARLAYQAIVIRPRSSLSPSPVRCVVLLSGPSSLPAMSSAPSSSSVYPTPVLTLYQFVTSVDPSSLPHAVASMEFPNPGAYWCGFPGCVAGGCCPEVYEPKWLLKGWMDLAYTLEQQAKLREDIERIRTDSQRTTRTQEGEAATGRLRAHVPDIAAALVCVLCVCVLCVCVCVCQTRGLAFRAVCSLPRWCVGC